MPISLAMLHEPNSAENERQYPDDRRPDPDCGPEEACDDRRENKGCISAEELEGTVAESAHEEKVSKEVNLWAE